MRCKLATVELSTDWRFVIHFNEGQVLDMLVLETPNSGKFTLSTQLMKPSYFVLPPTNAAPQFL